jgi:DNA-binding HxlR family transcriptional regulator
MCRVRAGAFSLSLLSAPLNVTVLRALEEQPTSLIDLRRAAGSPPQTTMRSHLRALTELGVLERRRERNFPGGVDFELGSAGRDLVDVAKVLSDWLARHPDGHLELGEPAAKSAIRALTDGWSAGIVRALAAKSLALTELSRLITHLSYPSIERRLGAMRLAGLIERCPGNGRGTPYSVTDFLAAATAPLAAAARWERAHKPAEAPPLGRLDVEAGFLLILPRLRLQEELSGTCRLVVELRGNGDRAFAGVLVRVEAGRPVSCKTRLEGDATAWAIGRPPGWFSAILEGDLVELEVGGDCELAYAMLRELNPMLTAVS